MRATFDHDTRTRRALLAVSLYLACAVVFFILADQETLTQHTRWNHFALLASSWLEGRLDLGAPPPEYTAGNDFAFYQGRWFVVFPPLPAVLLLPLVAFAKDPTLVRDGQFFIWLAPVAPAVLFLALEKLRRLGRSRQDTRTSFLLSLLFAWGTVYLFTAVQGTVWYAAHVVGATLAAIYLLFSLGAERPLVAGSVLGLALLTRPPIALGAPLFVLEALYRARAGPRPDWPGLARKLALFALPLAIAFGVMLAHNWARFGSPLDPGYEHLAVRWQPRMRRWGLFSYHYLARNLGVILTSLPYLNRAGDGPLVQINGHGLALWVTSPFYLWLVRARLRHRRDLGLALAPLLIALPSLFYQNTGWVQFGYRFSNDYAVFLFALFAVARIRKGALFRFAAAWALAVNGLGALTFGRPQYAGYYYIEPTQRVLYQPD